MDKMRLQELCQKRRWGLPEYTHSWTGTGQVPRFTASVTVDGSVFQSPDADSRSIKEAQNKAAAVAFETLSATPIINAAPSPPPSPAVVSISSQPSKSDLVVGTTDKAKLRELCQKRRWDLPQYTHSMVGSVREPRFVASVTVNGSVFECPDAVSRSIKEAQNKASAVAFEALSAARATDAAPSPSPSLVVQSLPPPQPHAALLVSTTYKVRLQELCQKRRWDLPQYTHSKVESVREPRFIASVTINGSVFESPDADSRSIKEAQNKAAAVAFETLFAAPGTNVVPSPPPPPSVESIAAQPSQMAIEACATSKSQLEVYEQKRKKELPAYTTVSVGIPHAPQLKATAEIDGLTFESPQYYKTMREAEQAAAEVALVNLRQEESSEQNSQDEVRVPCKTLLQEYVQKRKQPLPVYTTVRDPDSSLPLFLSTVQVFGMTFKGGVAKSKKQAEMSAAKVAIDHIKERRQSQVSSSSSASPPMNGTQNSCSSTMESKPPVPHVSLSLPTSKCEEVMSENQAGHQQSVAHESIIETPQESELPNNLTSKLTENQMPVAQESKLTENQMSVAAESKPLPANPISELFVTTNSICSEGPVLAATKDGDNNGIDPFLMLNRIQVYPRCPGSAVPNGAMPLPFSDELWTAVSLDYFQ